MTPAEIASRTASPHDSIKPSRPSAHGPLVVRCAGFGRDAVQDYVPVWRAMQAFTAARQADSLDELWLLSHQPVFTQGQAGRPEHVLNPGEIPIVQIDRGGQVTYHGPGQLVAYLLIDVRRSGIGIRDLVERIELAIIDVLARFGVAGESRRKAPGVYVKGAKIAALGLRVRQGCSYHGLSFNIDMDLSPFQRINPCGYQNLAVTQLKDHLATSPDTGGRMDEALVDKAAHLLVDALTDRLGYPAHIHHSGSRRFTDSLCPISPDAMY